MRSSALSCRFLAVLVSFVSVASAQDDTHFPEDFLIGIGSSSYQTEGGWNEDGKGMSVWDKWARDDPDRPNGDISADSYHKFKEDVKALKEMGAQVYRFSLSWTRILPSGLSSEINEPGIDYYNHLIDELLANGIQPMVTLYFWDLPQALQELGGWSNQAMADYFEEYARVAFSAFGDRVKLWVTMESSASQCIVGYGVGLMPPLVNAHGYADYLCGETMLLAHARAYHLYDNDFRGDQKGKIGIALLGIWSEPASDDALNVQAARTFLDFHLGWFANPIFDEEGDYPESMRNRVDENSEAEGRINSRLPHLDKETIKYVAGTSDFFGLDHYSTYLIKPSSSPLGPEPSWFTDTRVIPFPDPKWQNTSVPGFYIVPWGVRKILNYIKKEYGNPPVFITANGFFDDGGINDTTRIYYHYAYLREMLDAIHEDKCNVIGYTAWSLNDGYEWINANNENNSNWTCGMYQVDFEDPGRKRTPKLSAHFFKNMTTNRKL